MNVFSYLPAPPRSNTTTCFQLLNALQPPLQNFPFLFKSLAWVKLLNSYPGSIQIHLPMILCLGVQLSYKEFKAFILSKNLKPVLVDVQIIDKKLTENLES